MTGSKSLADTGFLQFLGLFQVIMANTDDGWARIGPLGLFWFFFCFEKKNPFEFTWWSRTDYRYQKQAQVEVIVEIRWVLPTLNLFFKLPRGPHIPFTLCHFWWFSEFPKDMWSFPGAFFFDGSQKLESPTNWQIFHPSWFNNPNHEEIGKQKIGLVHYWDVHGT